MNKEQLLQTISNLDAYLGTWKDEKEAYRGILVHHHKENLYCNHADVFTQSMMILSHLNIYQRTKDELYLKKAIDEGNYLASLYLKPAHHFAYSSFENKPVSSALVHEAWGLYALMKLFSFNDDKKYMEIAGDIINNNILKSWNGSAFFDKDNGLCTLNMGSIVSMALLEYSKHSKDDSLISRYVIPEMKYILKSKRLYGLFPYDNSNKGIRYITLYHIWTLRGIKAISEHLGGIYKNEINNAETALINMIDSKTGLYYHRWILKYRFFPVLKKYPEFLNCFSNPLLLEKMIFKNGSFKNTIGYDNIIFQSKPKPETLTYRDVIPSTAWNAYILEQLTGLDYSSIPKPNNSVHNRIMLSDNIVITEKEESLELYDTKGILFFCNKKDDYIYLRNRG